jgi:hypothetical protein
VTGDVATLSADFRIELPAAFCAERGWKAGQTFTILSAGSAVLFAPSPERNELAGTAEGRSRQTIGTAKIDFDVRAGSLDQSRRHARLRRASTTFWAVRSMPKSWMPAKAGMTGCGSTISTG